MNIKLVFKTVCRLLLLEAALLAVCLPVSVIFSDGCFWAYVESIGVILLMTLPVILLVKPKEKTLYFRDAMAVAGLVWILFSVFGSLPLVFSHVCKPADAFFEIASGFTTTGATIFSDVEALPESINFLRCFTHWFGGVGILVLTTAVLPSSDGSGARLSRAESTGPSYSKLLPKSGDNSKVLYIIYILLTVTLIIALRLCGMNLFDSILHAMSTAGTGGFSNKAASIGQYNSVAIEIVIGLFMLLFGISFGVYFKVLAREYKTAFKNEELLVYLCIIAAAVLLIAWNITGSAGSFPQALRQAFFQVTSISSTSGFCSVDFDTWPAFSKGILLLLMFIGSCAGSTAGGLKVVRVILLWKMGMREIVKSYSPHQVQIVRLDGKSVPEAMLNRIAVYFFVFMVTLGIGAFALCEGGCDVASSVTGSLACVSNVGPGLAMLGPTANFGFLPGHTKVILAIVMIAGRLEFYPIFMLAVPEAWRK